MNLFFQSFQLKKVLVGYSISFLVFISTLATYTDAQIAKGQDKFLGNVIGYSIPSEWTNYWNQVTPENAGKWGSVQRDNKDTFNWAPLKKQYEFAKANNYPFKQHTFVWGSQDPGWMKGTQLSDSEKKAAVIKWMTEFAKEFPDVDMIDVVNEPMHKPPEWKTAIGGDGSTGWDWVVWSFEQARNLFPKAKLIINEYGIISDPAAIDKYLTIIKILQDKKLVDGIGIQAHQFNIDNMSASNIKKNLDKLASVGLPIYPSELDVSGDDKTQLQRYKTIFPILWEHKAVKGITIWGYREGECWIKDKDTWLRSSSGSERSALKWLAEYVSGENRTYFLTTITSGKGTITRSVTKESYPKDTKVTLTAAPADGWIFSGWDGDVSGTSATVEITMNATTTTIAKFTREDGAVDLVLNGDFSAGKDPWTFNNWSGAGTGSVVNGEYSLTVQTPGAQHYDIQVVQSGIILKKDKSYILSFDAYAASSRDLYINIGQAISPWQTYLSGNSGKVALTTTKKTYTIETTMNFPDDDNARVEFSAGLETPTVFIDNVSLMEKSDAPLAVLTNQNHVNTHSEKMSLVQTGTNYMDITFDTYSSRSVQLKIFDLKGTLLTTKKISSLPREGLHTYHYNIATWSSGHYTAKILSDGPIQQAQMVINK